LAGVRVTLVQVDGAGELLEPGFYRRAAYTALRRAVLAATPALREPIMHLEVRLPDEHTGPVLGHLAAERGVVTYVEPGAHATRISAEVPLSQMFGYSTLLRSMTQGRASHSMHVLRMDLVPSHLGAALARSRDPE
jgi:elongation factor G